MILIVLLYFIVVIHCTTVKTILDNIGVYAEVAADIVNSVTLCEFRCPIGEFCFGIWCSKYIWYVPAAFFASHTLLTNYELVLK